MTNIMKKRNVSLLIIGVVLVIALVTWLLPTGSDVAFGQESLQEAVAEKGEIATTVTGTGNLETEGGEVITIPTGLTVQEVLVAQGDLVSEGDVLAVFDVGSVQSRIAAVQTELAELDREIESARRANERATITAGVAGRVTAIYAEVGGKVTDAMLDHGALLTLELQGEQTLSVTGTSGTVTRVHVREGDQVQAGTTLFTLTDLGVSATHRALVAERAELAQSLRTLLALAPTGQLLAGFDGIIENVAIGDGSASPTVPPMGGLPAGVPPSMFGLRNSTNDSGIIGAVRLSETESEEEAAEPPAPPVLNEITSIADMQLVAPVAGQTPQTNVQGANYTGAVQWLPATEVFMPATVYQANIILTANDGHTFGHTAVTGLAAEGFPTPGATVLMAEIMGNQMAVAVSFQPTQDLPSLPNLPDLPDFAMPGMPNFNFPSMAMPNMDASAFAGMDSGQNTSERAAFTIARADAMRLTIMVDERDILSLSLGQRAEVNLDAVPSERFQGEITRINTAGNTSGGGARYVVEVTLPRTEQMLPGMSASAVITTAEAADILLIPAEALQEQGLRVFVYTGQSGGRPTDPVDVQTGLSDGMYVEITQGLVPGDVVYYVVTNTPRWPQFGIGPGMGPGGGNT